MWSEASRDDAPAERLRDATERLRDATERLRDDLTALLRERDADREPVLTRGGGDADRHAGMLGR